MGFENIFLNWLVTSIIFTICIERSLNLHRKISIVLNIYIYIFGLNFVRHSFEKVIIVWFLTCICEANSLSFYLGMYISQTNPSQLSIPIYGGWMNEWACIERSLNEDFPFLSLHMWTNFT